MPSIKPIIDGVESTGVPVWPVHMSSVMGNVLVFSRPVTSVSCMAVLLPTKQTTDRNPQLSCEIGPIGPIRQDRTRERRQAKLIDWVGIG